MLPPPTLLAEKPAGSFGKLHLIAPIIATATPTAPSRLPRRGRGMLRALPRWVPPDGVQRSSPAQGDAGPSPAEPSPAQQRGLGAPTGRGRRGPATRREPVTVDAGLVSHGSARLRSAPLLLRRVPGRKRLRKQHRPLPEPEARRPHRPGEEPPPRGEEPPPPPPQEEPSLREEEPPPPPGEATAPGPRYSAVWRIRAALRVPGPGAAMSAEWLRRLRRGGPAERPGGAQGPGPGPPPAALGYRRPKFLRGGGSAEESPRGGRAVRGTGPERPLPWGAGYAE